MRGCLLLIGILTKQQNFETHLKVDRILIGFVTHLTLLLVLYAQLCVHLCKCLLFHGLLDSEYVDLQLKCPCLTVLHLLYSSGIQNERKSLQN